MFAGQASVIRQAISGACAANASATAAE